MRKVTLLNVVTSLIMQIVSIVSALIVPRLMLETFGSGVNGMVSSIGQFLNYIALIEGGITGVISANLYGPLVLGDTEKVSLVIATARHFYRKIAFIFIGYSAIVGVVYPFFVNTGFNNIYVFVFTMVLSLGLMLEYMFSLTYTTFLNADKKGYIVYITSSALTVLNIFLTVIVVNYYPDIILLKFANASLFALKPLILGVFIKNQYKVDWKVNSDSSLIEQRWNGFSINFAFFIHASTDITILTIFSDLPTVSVYSVYYLIVSKISVLLHSITSGIEPAIGHAYAIKDEKQLNEKMDIYEFVTLVSVGVLFSLTGLLITPFVMVYTKGITDADYYQPLFGVILVLAEAIYLLRAPHVSLAYSANKFKEITIPAYIEAIINIFISIVLVRRVGLVGIALGTLAGMIYRGAFHVKFTENLVPSRKQNNYYKKIILLLFPCVVSVVICINLFPIMEYTFKIWLVYAIVYGIITCMLYFIVCYVFFIKELQYIKRYLRK